MLRRASLLTSTSVLLMFPSQGTMRRQNQESQAHRPNDFDIDKEKWSKQLQMGSLECVIDPNVTPINMWSISGIRKWFTHWISLKKLQERRPSFKIEDLLEQFADYKVLQNSLDPEKLRQLVRYTTFAESDRLNKECTSELHARMKNSSWKTIASTAGAKSIKQQKADAAAAAAAQAAAEKAAADAAAAAAEGPEGKSDKKSSGSSSAGGSKEEKQEEVIARRMGNSNMAGVNPYEIEISKFEITNCFIGTMTNEDWIQLTVKAEYREKNANVGPMAIKAGQSGAAALRSKAMGVAGQKDQLGFVRCVEYPVFEVKLGDGVTTANNQPFSIVAVLDKDGSRYGKDGNDASMLRKNFANSKKSWFGGGSK